MTSKPKRIQRQRTKGWRMPPGVVNVTRPGFWGNPFTVDEWGMDLALQLYRDALQGFWNPSNLPSKWPDEKFQRGVKLFQSLHRQQESLYQLHGVSVACWCRLDHSCHGDILLELANP